MKYYIAVDIGGTRMRAAAYAEDSLKPASINRIKTRKKSSPPLKRLKKLIQSVWPDNGEVTAIGIAVPGPVNAATGVIEKAPNVPELDGMAVSNVLCETFGVPAFLGNDANLAALGEWKFGAGKGHHHMVYLTISTGIGSGVIINDQLFAGSRGFAPELGHTIIDPDGPVCGCGVRGHLEALASGTAISKWVAAQIDNGAETSITLDPDEALISGARIAAAVKQGDPLARKAYRRLSKHLGMAIADFLHIFNPTIIVLGGGVSQSYDLFEADLLTSISANLMIPDYLDNLVITTAHLRDDVGLMGALALARESTTQP